MSYFNFYLPLILSTVVEKLRFSKKPYTISYHRFSWFSQRWIFPYETNDKIFVSSWVSRWRSKDVIVQLQMEPANYLNFILITVFKRNNQIIVYITDCTLLDWFRE